MTAAEQGSTRPAGGVGSWSLDPDTFGRVVEVLLSRLHHEVRRFGGLRHDDGVDIYFPESAGVVAYTCKAFGGRLTPQRRSSILRSLHEVERQNPSRWTLVVATHLRPADRTWFETETRSLPYHCEVKDAAWLDNLVSRFPEVADFYAGSASARIADLLAELSRSRGLAKLGSDVALTRMRTICKELNTLDPQYSYGLINDGQADAVSVWPKYPGAEFDRPRTLRVTGSFPATDEGRAAAERLRDAYGFGVAVEVEPAYLRSLTFALPEGVTQEFSGGHLKLDGARVPSLEGTRILYRLLDEFGRTVAQLPMRVTRATAGQAGAELHGEDASGTLTARLRIDQESRRIDTSFTYSTIASLLPSEVLPAAQFLSRLHSPNQVAVIVDDAAVGEPIPVPADRSFNPDLARFADLVAAFSEIQQHTGVYFPMPPELTRDEMHDVFVARRLLAGHEVETTWDRMVLVSTVESSESLQSALVGGPHKVQLQSELSLTLRGQEFPLGVATQVTLEAFIDSWPEIQSMPPEAEIEIVLVPGRNRKATTRLVDIPDLGPTRNGLPLQINTKDGAER